MGHPVTAYEVGRRFEYKIIHDLEAKGFSTVRAAASAGTMKVDIVAARPGRGHHGPIGEDYDCSCHADFMWIQAKRDGKISPAEWNRVMETAMWVNASPVLASNGPNGRGIVYTLMVKERVPRKLVEGYATPYIFV
jgi:hypothetical protein